jgi:hypothetical protein
VAMVFLASSIRNRGEYIEIGHDCFLPRLLISLFIIILV